MISIISHKDDLLSLLFVMSCCWKICSGPATPRIDVHDDVMDWKLYQEKISANRWISSERGCNGELWRLPYHFSRSSIKFQGHTGWKINDLDQIWARLLDRSQLSNPSDLPCCYLNKLMHAQRVVLPVIWDVITLMWCHCNVSYVSSHESEMLFTMS